MKHTLLVSLLAVGCASLPTHNRYELKLSPVAANNLMFLYEHLEVEFAFCVYGTANGTITIERITLPIITRADAMTVRFQDCPKDGYLGLGHSHLPDTTCELSGIDIEGFVDVDDRFCFLLCRDDTLKAFEKGKVHEVLRLLPAVVGNLRNKL